MPVLHRRLPALILLLSTLAGCGAPESPAPAAVRSAAGPASTTRPTTRPTARPTKVPAPPTATPVLLQLVKGGNFRRGPGVDFPIIQPLEVGTAVRLYRTVLASDGGRWFYVRIETQQEGWVSNILVQADQASIDAVPVDTATYIAPTPLPAPTAKPAPPPAAAPPAAAKPRVRYDPNGPDRDCGDFDTYAEAYAFFVAAGGPSYDPHRLDGDNDGIPCESLP
jgi:hypothetical protein